MVEACPPIPAKAHELGVLMVHGIGRQGRADTLVAWTDRLISTINAGSDGESYARTAAAHLTPSDADAPPFVEIEISTGGPVRAGW